MVSANAAIDYMYLFLEGPSSTRLAASSTGTGRRVAPFEAESGSFLQVLADTKTSSLSCFLSCLPTNAVYGVYIGLLPMLLIPRLRELLGRVIADGGITKGRCPFSFAGCWVGTTPYDVSETAGERWLERDLGWAVRGSCGKVI